MKKLGGKLFVKIVALAVAAMLVVSPVKAEEGWVKEGITVQKEWTSKVRKVIAIAAGVICTGALIGIGIYFYNRRKQDQALEAQ